MTETPRRYDVTIIVDREDGHMPNPAEFAAAAEHAASARTASIVSVHTASQIISVVTVRTVKRSVARGRRLGHRVRRAEVSGRVIHPLTRPL